MQRAKYEPRKKVSLSINKRKFRLRGAKDRKNFHAFPMWEAIKVKTMLYIVRKCDVEFAKMRRKEGRYCETNDYPWHIGEVRPCLADKTPFEDVCEIQADGHELLYIRSRFKNLPEGI